ncbi:MAG: CBS domain-containing protein, partial [Alphaproteobacteria bacterium]|nr:CBS domain-containing protein [Alphaproteobacteria bacterium]
TASPVCVRGDMRVEDALNKIRSHAFRYMPVLDGREGGKLIGIVSERELVWHVHGKLHQTIQTQTGFLSFFIQEPYCGGSAAI